MCVRAIAWPVKLLASAGTEGETDWQVCADHDVEAAVRAALAGLVFAPARRSAGGLPGTRRVGRPHRRRAGAHPDRPPKTTPREPPAPVYHGRA